MFSSIFNQLVKNLTLLLLFLLDENYGLGATGGTCVDEGLLDININQCHNALETIKKDHPNAADRITDTDSWPDLPKGCFFQMSNKIVYWNSHQIGRSSNDARPVCRKKGMLPFNKGRYFDCSTLKLKVMPKSAACFIVSDSFEKCDTTNWNDWSACSETCLQGVKVINN